MICSTILQKQMHEEKINLFSLEWPNVLKSLNKRQKEGESDRQIVAKKLSLQITIQTKRKCRYLWLFIIIVIAIQSWYIVNDKFITTFIWIFLSYLNFKWHSSFKWQIIIKHFFFILFLFFHANLKLCQYRRKKKKMLMRTLGWPHCNWFILRRLCV